MKTNFLLVALSILLFTACQEQKSRYTQSSPEIETVKSLIDDYNTKNYVALVAKYSDTAKTTFNRSKMASSEIPKYHEANDVNYSSRSFLEDGQEYEMVVDDEGKTWVNFWGTWKGTLAGNGKEMLIPVHLTARFIDGKVVEDYGYWDTSEVVLALQEIEASKGKELEEVSVE